MTWFDIVAILIVVVIAWAESVRGFGRALYDLIGALIVINLCLFYRIARIAQFYKIHAFYNPAVFYVQAGDYSFRKHTFIASPRLIVPS